MAKFFEGHEEEDSKHDVVLYVDGEPRVAQVPYPRTPFKTLTESVEEAWEGMCGRCIPGVLHILDLATAQKKSCNCAEHCGEEFCAGDDGFYLAATAPKEEAPTRYCGECGERLSDQYGTLSGLCPTCESENVWGR